MTKFSLFVSNTVTSKLIHMRYQKFQILHITSKIEKVVQIRVKCYKISKESTCTTGFSPHRSFSLIRHFPLFSNFLLLIFPFFILQIPRRQQFSFRAGIISNITTIVITHGIIRENRSRISDLWIGIRV
ncbi:hypothetical protein ABFS83_14G071000 [Erythranthe nasuta]